MQPRTTAGVLAALLSFALAPALVAAQAEPPSGPLPAGLPRSAQPRSAQRLSAGDAAFAAGTFDPAATAYAAALAANPNDADAELGLGTVELYRNHLPAARAHLQRALQLAPDSTQARARLGTIVQRTAGASDFRIAFAGAQANVPLVAIDPLPTFAATIDGVAVKLVIDTGGPNLDVTAALARRLHLATHVTGEGFFAGNRRAQVRSARIDRLDLPGLTVRGIPGGVIPGGAPPGIDGVIGTGFLYHFLATIDYAHGVLVLRPPGASAAFVASAKAARATIVPMWLVGDHFVFVRAHANAAPEGLFSIDTGGPGVGVDLSKSSLTAAGITPDAAHPRSMMGGGGPAQLLPFTAAGVTMGDHTEHDVPGVYVLGGGMDDLFPFAVAGRISHEFFRHLAVTFDFSAMVLVLAQG